MAAIALAVVNLIVIRRLMFVDVPESVIAPNTVPVRVKMLAGTSLFFWATALTAGRLTAYLGAGALAKGSH
jgi:hypothetical protein